MTKRFFSKGPFWIWIVLALGVFLRLQNVIFRVQEPGFDLQSYSLVVDLIEQGKSVYANTERYNYGPVWFSILFLLKKISCVFSGDGDWPLFNAVVFFLVLVDVAIAFVLRAVFGVLPFCVFLLFPSSIGITAFHAQFENLALLLGLLGFVLGFLKTPPRFFPKFLLARPWFWSSVLFGFSLMTKHILIFFLPWVLFFSAQSLFKRFQFGAIAFSIFLAGFLPWTFDAPSRVGIVSHVINYNSDTSKKTAFRGVFDLALPGRLQGKFELGSPGGGRIYFPSEKILWMLSLLFGGILVMRRRPRESFFLYLPLLVGLSPAAAEQYFTIPAMTCAVYSSLALPWVFAVLTLPTGYPFLLTKVFKHATWPIEDLQKQFWLLVIFAVIALKKAQNGRETSNRAPSPGELSS